MKVKALLVLFLFTLILSTCPTKSFAEDADSFFSLCKTGTVEQVQVAIDAGADVNANDKTGYTALMFAALFNQNPEIIATLTKAGADINARDKDGKTALMYAATENENPEIITTLIRAGADVKAKDETGKRAIDYAGKNEKLKGTDAYWKLSDMSY